MATLNAAVQQMIDRLNAALAAGTADAETQLLISRAISYLQSHATWEQALIAVAEQHLNTGTTALAAAKALLDAAKATLDSSSAALNTQAANLAMIPQIRRDVALLPSLFTVGNSRHDARIETVNSTYQVEWCLSMDDHETGVFSCYLSRYNGSAFANQHVAINAVGVVTVNAFTPSLGSVSAILPAPNGKSMLWTLSGTTVTVYNGGLAAPVFTFTMQDQVVFFDRATRKSYVRSSNALMEVTDVGAVIVSPTVELANVAAFRTYAAARGWIEYNGGAFFATASSGSALSVVAIPSNSYSAPYLTFGRDVSGAVSKFGYVSYSPPSKDNHLVARVLAEATSGIFLGNIVYDGTSLGGGSTANCSIVEAVFDIRFSPLPNVWRGITVKVVPDMSVISSSGVQLRTPQVIAFSSMHNAVVVRGSYDIPFSSGSSTTSIAFTVLSFGR